MQGFSTGVEWFFLGYFALLQASYFVLVMVAFVEILSRLPKRGLRPLPPVAARYAPPVSIIMPAYNEEAMILSALESILKQDYPSLQIVIVNDGSKDGTMQVLDRGLGLIESALPARSAIESEPVRQVYRTGGDADVIVVDKKNGGKADAVNAGINHARHDLICIIDADTVFERDSIRRTVDEFFRRPNTIAVGGTILALNGCKLDDEGFVEEARLPRNYWARIQSLEYIRAFLFGRMGWVPFNGLPIISGAFGLFDRQAVVEAGGYRRDTVGEDMELTLKLHRTARAKGEPYHIGFVHGPVAWTEVPESYTELQQQRIRWHQGLSECVELHRGMLFRGGAVGWFSLPAQILFEWLSPIFELAGYLLTLLAWSQGLISDEAVVAFLILALGLSVLLSVASVLLEEIALRVYPRLKDVFTLCLYGFLETFGYRQINAAWRMIGFLRWAFRSGYSWG